MFYEILQDGTIGRSTPNEKIAKNLRLTLKTNKEIVYGFDGRRYFKGQEPTPPEPLYTELRAAEYPPAADFLDAQVKINSGNETLIAEGQIQLAEYVAACLNVKEKYQKKRENK